jgi:hypothetical protein
MMEQPQACKAHHHVMFIAAFDDGIVADGTAGLRDVLHAAQIRTFDVVREREERVGAERDVLYTVQIRPLFLRGKGLGPMREKALPYALCADVLFILIDIAVDDVVTVRSRRLRQERQIQNLSA